MKAIILAAGRGSRMGKETEYIPKCMITLAGRTLLDRCIEVVGKCGIKKEDIGIVTGYKQEKINIEGVKYFHNPNWENTNMFISLTMAKQWLENDTCLVCYSDIVFQEESLIKLINSTEDIAITYYTKYRELWEKRFEDPLKDLETFKVESEKVIEIGKKPQSFDDIEGQYMGLIKIQPKGWAKIEEAVKKPLKKPIEKLDMTTLLQFLIELGEDIHAIQVDDLWLECDNYNDVMLYEKCYNDFL